MSSESEQCSAAQKILGYVYGSRAMEGVCALTSRRLKDLHALDLRWFLLLPKQKKSGPL